MAPRNRVTQQLTATAPGNAAPFAHRPARTKIAVIGYTDHRQFAPYTDDAWEVWGLNDLYYELPVVPPDRLRWFQVHPWKEVETWAQRPVDTNPLDFSGGPPHPRDPNHVAWLRGAAEKCPVYLMSAREEVPGAIVYPKAEAFAYFSLDGDRALTYFTNSISWMIGLAIMELCPGGPGTPAVEGAELGVWGVDMMMGGGNGSEYGWQRPSCEFFLGWARACGIRVVLPDESDLLKSAFPYGDSHGAAYRKKLQNMRNEYARRSADLSGQMQQCQAGIAELRGAIDTLDWQLRSWAPGDSEAPTAGRAPGPNTHKELAEPGTRLVSLVAASDGDAP